MTLPIEPKGNTFQGTASPAKTESEVVSKTNEQAAKIPVHPDVPQRTMKAEPQESSKVVFPNVSKKMDEASAIQEKSSVIWECKSLIPDVSGGYIYTFRLRDEFDDITDDEGRDDRMQTLLKKVNEMFPAIEVGGSMVMNLLTKIPGISEKFNELGFEAKQTEKGVFLTVPDKTVLEARWEKLREKHPQLPVLKFTDSDGIANDVDFIKAYFKYDGMISTNKEFIHDMLSHILVMLLNHIESVVSADENPRNDPMRYSNLMKGFKKMVEEENDNITILREIKNDPNFPISAESRALIADKLQFTECVLAAIIDGTTGVPMELLPAESSMWNYRSEITTMFEDPRWKAYFEEKFGKDSVEKATINNLRAVSEKAIGEYKAKSTKKGSVE